VLEGDAALLHRSRQCGKPKPRLWLGGGRGGGNSAEQVRLIGAETKEIAFTSGARKAQPRAERGLRGLLPSKGNHLITVVTEHKAVLDSCLHIEKLGGEVTYCR